MNKLKKLKKLRSKEENDLNRFDIDTPNERKSLKNLSNYNIQDNPKDTIQDNPKDTIQDNPKDTISKDAIQDNPTLVLNNIIDDTLSSKEQCLIIVKQSIEKYLNTTELIDIDSKDIHYKSWLKDFSIEDFKNEYKNSESGNFYNYVYHNLWDSYFDTDGFIIVNKL